jgi:hypothetical protein
VFGNTAGAVFSGATTGCVTAPLPACGFGVAAGGVAGTVAVTMHVPVLSTDALNVTPLLFVADPLLTVPPLVLPAPFALPLTEICMFSFVTSTVLLFVTVVA